MNEIKTKGLDELQRFLNQLPAKVEANIMRSALRAGANVIATEARQNCPVDDGDLRASIRVSAKRKRGTVTASVKAGDEKAWYWRFVEYGTRAHTIKAKDGGMLYFNGVFRTAVHHPGARPHPFMRPALDTQAGAAVQAVANQIKRRLTKVGIDAADTDAGVEE